MKSRWRNVTSNSFYMSNCIRQGYVLSPYLFTIYIDDLLIMLTLMRYKQAAVLASSFVNHLMFSDDIVVFARVLFAARDSEAMSQVWI